MNRQQHAFLARTCRDGECLLWTGRPDGQGYGSFTMDGRKERAHRAAWKLFCGPIPKGKLVLHTCDNPGCVRWDEHLYLGTHADNSRDMKRRGRHRSGRRTYRQYVRIDITGPLSCHIWRGATTRRGYPVMKVDGKTRLARRVIYERRKRSLSPGERVEMDCGERLCVNEAHMHAKA